MAVSIASYGANGLGPAGYGGRHVARLSTGRLLTLFRASGGNRLEVWYSDDNGATWAENTSARVSLHTNFAAINWSITIFVDASDNVHIAYLGGGLDSEGYMWYRVGATVGTGGAFGSEYEVREEWGTGYTLSFLSMVAHTNISAGTGWQVHLAYGLIGGSWRYVLMRTLTINTSYAVTGVDDKTVYGTSTAATLDPRIDFHHTGDGKTIQGSTPHLYIAHGYASGLAVIKYTYSAGTWTAGTLRQIDSGAIWWVDATFDGARFNVAYVLDATRTVVRFSERDAADTTTTARTPTALSDGNIEDIAVTHQGSDKSVVVGAIGTTSDDASYSKFDRTAGTWGSWTALEAGTATRLSAARGTLGRRADFVWDNAGTSVRHGQAVYNTAPSAPSWVSPVDYAGADVGAALVLDWTFSDVDLDDSQTAYAVKRQIGAGTLYYWRASDSTWQTSETKNVSVTTTITVASGWGSDGDANHTYAVKTWDVIDAAGVYGANLTVVPSTPDLPTITTPTDASTHVSSTITAVWTVATQTTYLVQLLDSAGTTVLWSSGTQTSTGTRSHAIAYTLLNGVSYKVRVTTANDEGLVGTADTNSFSVAYTAPAVPIVTVTADTPTGAITVAHANLNPVGTQPTVTSADIYVRCTTGTYPDGERPVGGNGIRVKTGLAPEVDWVDYAPASGRAYEYKVRVYGDNGTTTDSAWMSAAPDPALPLLLEATLWLDSAYSVAGEQSVVNQGTGGAVLDARYGSTTGVDTNDPLWLGHPAGGNYAYLTGVDGNYLSVPDSAALDITGDMELVVRCALPDWSPSVWMQFVGKEYDTYELALDDTTGKPVVNIYDGTFRAFTSSVATGFTDGTAYWLKATLDIDNGAGGATVKFYTAADQATEPSSWTQLGADVTIASVGAIIPNNRVVTVGSRYDLSTPLTGIVRRAIIRDGIGGSTVLDINCAIDITDSDATSFTATTGQTVTVNRSTSGRKTVLVTRPVWLLGVDDYFEIPDNALLDFGANQDFTALAVYRSSGASGAADTIFGKGHYGLSPSWAIMQPNQNGQTFLGFDDGTSGYYSNDLVAADHALQVVTLGRAGAVLSTTLNGGANVGATYSAGTLSGPITSTAPVRVGASNVPNEYADAEIVAVAVFRRALTTTEIANLVAYWEAG